MAKRVLVTAALPYANGSIHLGHMLEAVQTDVHVRARKLAGEDCRFMWADDTHGTPIQVRARKEGVEPEAIIAKAYEEHRRDFTDFQIGFDVFHSTHTKESKQHVHAVYGALKERGNIESRSIDQLYCPHDEMFLPDRFVKGTCPKCKSPDQYGDNCEVCGSTYNPTDLIDPHCAICGTEPVMKASEHLFVDLAKHTDFLRGWLNTGGIGGNTPLQSSVKNYVMEWVEGGLRDWDISRDAPYFGWEIPGHPGKFFYVWFDAPIGYIGATQKWCNDNGADALDYWGGKDRDDVEIVHVIGKDIVYFHCLFWPAMLHAAGYTTPSRVQVHGWLTVDGEKMSKSRGTFILARTYLEHLPSDYLRYYFAAKVGAKVEDIDLSFEDFVNRCNAELVNKAANLCSRCVKFVGGRLGGTMGALQPDTEPLVAAAQAKLGQAIEHYRNFESPKAVRLAMEVAEDFNQYLTDKAPWKLAKTDPEAARSICSAGIFASQVVAAILAPVLPTWAEKVQRMLNIEAPLTFSTAGTVLPAGHAIAEYETLAERIDPKTLEAMVEASKQEEAAPKRTFDYEVPELTDETKIDAFEPIDLRVGKVVGCEAVPKANKLLQLTIDLGPLGMRNIFSGIAKSYAPEDLVGKNVAVFANLKPRKMRFGMSEGMVLASGESDDAITVLELDAKAKPGEKIS
ncbi:MAG: methionine--tRNA ligase [Myxococcota bacterium]